MFVMLLLICELSFGLTKMPNDLLPPIKDDSKSCIFGWPDRPGDTLPPDYPPINPPGCYPYCAGDDWPLPVIPPFPFPDMEPPGPLPGSTPHLISEFDLAIFESTNVFNLWFCKIVSAGSLTTEFQPSAIENPPFIPPDIGFLYNGIGPTLDASNAFVGINRVDGQINRAFVNFRKIRETYPLMTFLSAVYSIGWPVGFFPGENANFTVQCYKGTAFEEFGNSWQPIGPDVELVDVEGNFNATHSGTEGFRKVLKIDYNTVAKTATIYENNPPV